MLELGAQGLRFRVQDLRRMQLEFVKSVTQISNSDDASPQLSSEVNYRSAAACQHCRCHNTFKT